MNDDRKLRRQMAIGVVISDARFADKLTLIRAMRDDAKWEEMKKLVTDVSAAAGIDVASPEFDWDKFYEFLKWLIPLLLELLVTLG